ncbi:MAG: sugar phosphate nucleotidyltransferase [bacterium]|nr:sugar phosphate nucleotidyltransferase [bacterium]
MDNAVKKAIIPIAGLGTRFLPLSKILPKELWPLADKPVLQYILEEVLKSGIKEVIFVTRPEKKLILDYFQKRITSNQILKSRHRTHFQEELKNLENLCQKISFTTVFQKKPLGDGNALLQTAKLVRKENCAALWSDDVVESKIPCLLQLIKVFQKYKKPVIALYRVPKESFKFYGMVKVKKVAPRTYKILKIKEKPSNVKESPSNLAIVGKYILTPEVFNWLKKFPKNEKGELITGEVLAKAIESGEDVYGYEFEGKWLECGNKLAYLKSNLYLSLKHPQFGKELKKFLKNQN